MPEYHDKFEKKADGKTLVNEWCVRKTFTRTFVAKTVGLGGHCRCFRCCSCCTCRAQLQDEALPSTKADSVCIIDVNFINSGKQDKKYHYQIWANLGMPEFGITDGFITSHTQFRFSESRPFPDQIEFRIYKCPISKEGRNEDWELCEDVNGKLIVSMYLNRYKRKEVPRQEGEPGEE